MSGFIPQTPRRSPEEHNSAISLSSGRSTVKFSTSPSSKQKKKKKKKKITSFQFFIGEQLENATLDDVRLLTLKPSHQQLPRQGQLALPPAPVLTLSKLDPALLHSPQEFGSVDVLVKWLHIRSTSGGTRYGPAGCLEEEGKLEGEISALLLVKGLHISHQVEQ